MRDVTIQELVQNSVHFGHKRQKWNPKMKKYILAEKGGVHVLDMSKTKGALEDACAFLKNAAMTGKKILFVGTKPQASKIVTEMAKELGCSYVNKKWPAGLLTNWKVFETRVAYLKHLREEKEDGSMDKNYTKKEVSKFHSEMAKLETDLGGVESMKGLPDIMFVVDPLKEELAVKEANLCKIPVVAIVDTNANPDNIDIVIPANDDARNSLSYILGHVKEAAKISGGREKTATANVVNMTGDKKTA